MVLTDFCMGSVLSGRGFYRQLSGTADLAAETQRWIDLPGYPGGRSIARFADPGTVETL
jgi:hypothetical protein